ncbi:hypothetical protein BJX99DRAFT_224615 [Aspergillus californicus]
MAEVVGFVSAGVGIAAFVLQITDSIKQLREIRNYVQTKAAGDIESIVGRLEVLQQILNSLQGYQGHRAVDVAIGGCQLEYSRVDTIIQRLRERLAKLSKGKRWTNFRKAPDVKKEIHEAREIINSAIMDLSLSLMFDLHQTTVVQTQTIQMGAVSPIASGLIANGPWPNTQQSSFVPETKVNPAQQMPRTSLAHRAYNCSIRHCHCSCHSTVTRFARFWAFEYTPLSTFFATCDNTDCTGRRYRWGLRLALTQYGIPFAVLTGGELILAGGKYSLRPALSLERTVRYTSPGFETLERVLLGLISLPEAKERFLALQKSDPSLKYQVNPAGHGYIQSLICRSTMFHVGQIALLDFFVTEMGMSMADQGPSFLVECAKWIGEGPHLDLLDAVLELGFDPSGDSPLYDKWPAVCSPEWFGGGFTPDPFFIEYFAIVARENPGFGGLTPLHEAAFQGATESVAALISRPTTVLDAANFLGQTPLHFAVSNLEVCSILLEAGHDINVTDKKGITPLMYAAASGQTQIVQLLIKSGANIAARDHNLHRTFIRYASLRGHWDLVLDSLDTIKFCYNEEASQIFATHSISILVSGHDRRWLGDKRQIYFARLVQLCHDVESIRLTAQETKHNTVLHFVLNCTEVETLVQSGFTRFNQQNSKGQLALHVLAPNLNPELTTALLDHGMNVNHVDQDGRTVLCYLLSQLSCQDHRTADIIASITVCLKKGLDISAADNCRCACSPYGCSITAALDINFQGGIIDSKPSCIWGLELLSLVEEYQGQETAKAFLLSLIRRSLSDTFDITHVCCHRGSGVSRNRWSAPPGPLAEEDIDEILDEEDELLDALDAEMHLLQSESLEGLRSRWLRLLKKKFDERVQEVEVQSKANKTPDDEQSEFSDLYIVDYKDDSWSMDISCDSFVYEPSVAAPIEQYAAWLEVEYGRKSADEDFAEVQAWYNRRSSWFRELMCVMDVNIPGFRGRD